MATKPEQDTIDPERELAMGAATEAGLTQARLTLQRAGGLARTKARTATREAKDPRRAAAAKVRAEQWTARAASIDDEVVLAEAREILGDSYGTRPSAYGRVVGADGKGVPGVPVAVLAEGKVVASGKTDEDGSFAIVVPDEVDGDLSLEIGDGGSLQKRPLPRARVPRAQVVRAEPATKRKKP